MDLTAGRRNALTGAQFAGPGRSFPIPDANHARLAIAMAARSANAGNITQAEARTIQARARNALKDPT